MRIALRWYIGFLRRLSCLVDPKMKLQEGNGDASNGANLSCQRIKCIKADGACDRACRGWWDWGQYAVQRRGDSILTKSTLARSTESGRIPASDAAWMRCQHTSLLSCM